MTFLFLVFQQGFEKHNDEIFVTRILVLEKVWIIILIRLNH